MSAAAIIERARKDGVTLVLDAAGKLKARGNDAAVARWLPAIRDHKPALLALLTEPRRLWLIQHADGHVESHRFTPPATLAEVRSWYADAKSIEPEAPPVPARRQPQAAR